MRERGRQGGPRGLEGGRRRLRRVAEQPQGEALDETLETEHAELVEGGGSGLGRGLANPKPNLVRATPKPTPTPTPTLTPTPTPTPTPNLVEGGGADGEERVELAHELAAVVHLGERVREGAVEEHLRVQVRDGEQREHEQAEVQHRADPPGEG